MPCSFTPREHNAEALQVIRDATVEEHQRRFFDLLTYLCLFAGEDWPTKFDRVHLGALTEMRPETDDLYYPIFSFVCLTFILDPDEFQYALIRGGIEDIGHIKLAKWTRPRDGAPPNDTQPCLSPFQLAMGYLALGDFDWASDLLRVDVEAGHPLMVWLHLWPLFDPLRVTPGFNNLLSQMHLPRQRND